MKIQFWFQKSRREFTNIKDQQSQLLISLSFKATILQRKSKTIIFKTHHKNKTVFHLGSGNIFWNNHQTLNVYENIECIESLLQG